MFKKKKPKTHEDEPFLIAHILRNAGSVSSLLHYIKSHPRGGDAARKDIIKIKYWYSKCSPVIMNIVRKMVIDFHKFEVEVDGFRGMMSDDIYEYFKIKDLDNGLWFRFNTNDYKIEIPNDGILSSEIHDCTLFLFATRSVLYIKNNISVMKESQKTEQMKSRYVDSYR